MKFNVWKYDPRNSSSTGPWAYLCTVRAKSEAEACTVAMYRYALKEGKLKAYPHIDNIDEHHKRDAGFNLIQAI